MRKTVILTLLLFFLLLGNELLALDKRLPIHNPMPHSIVFKLNTVYAEQISDQYNALSQYVNRVKNSSEAMKAQLCYTPSKKYSIALESIYLFSRKQENTAANGQVSTPLDSSGWGDTALQLTFQPFDSRKQKFGLLIGGEVQFPTGNQEKGLGSGSTDFSLRSTLSLRSAIGFPYLAAIYTWTGRGEIDGVKTEDADDLFLALGYKTRYLKGLAVNVRGFIYLQQDRSRKYSNGTLTINEKYNLPGYRCELFYAFGRNAEISIFAEQSWPEDSRFTANGTPMTRKPDARERFGASVRLKW